MKISKPITYWLCGGLSSLRCRFEVGSSLICLLYGPAQQVTAPCTYSLLDCRR